MFKNKIFVFMFFVSIIFPTFANEENIILIDGNEMVQNNIDCKGKIAVVNGTENVLSFTGFCSGLRVKGNGNTITIELKPNAILKVDGVDNTIQWNATKAPKVNIHGANNTIGSN